MTIKSLEGADWEGHEYFHMKFSEGMNTIIGLSHHGKSSIVRALNWVLENRPQGTPYFPHGKSSPSTEVSLTFDDGKYITRVRNKETNHYETSGNSSVFTALRAGVPDEVREVSDMLDRNIQSQKDVHFFLTETAGKRAKMLNEVANLEEMDIAMDLINKNVSDIRSEYNVKTKSLNKYEDEVKDLLWVEEALLDSENVELFQKKMYDSIKEKNEIESIVNGINIHMEELEKLLDTSALPELEDILKFDENLTEMEDRESEVNGIVKMLQFHNNELERAIIPDDKELSNAEAITVEIKHISERSRVIQNILEQMKTLTEMFVAANREVKEQELLFNETLLSMGRCPLCGK